jgi:hypothetical protein
MIKSIIVIDDTVAVLVEVAATKVIKEGQN